MLIEQSGSFAY